MAEYADRLVTLDFPELSEDPRRDPLWVVIRNPMHVAPPAPRARGGEDQGPSAAVCEIIAELVVAWRLYDATTLDVDPFTAAVTQPLLPPPPVTPDLVRRLPAPVVDRIMREVAEAANPPAGPGDRFFEDVQLPAESIFEGTWASGPGPQELADFLLLERMHWSWADLQATPRYVRAYCWTFINARAEAEANRR